MITVGKGKYTYRIKDHLGGGTYGSMFRFKQVGSNEKFALKTIKKKNMQNLDDYSEKLLKREFGTH